MIQSALISDIVRMALLEDLGPGDLTSHLVVDPNHLGRGRLIARERMVVSGLKAVAEVFRQVDPSINFTPCASDGYRLDPGEEIGHIDGTAISILSAERVALNFLMRLSGVATLTARYVEAAGNPKVSLVDTRKTTPGLRLLEKEAVRHGGGRNHRFALYDGILIKDNHVAAAGSISNAVAKAKAKAPQTMKVEVEVDTLEQLKEALSAGADIVMLDNMMPDLLRTAVKIVTEFHAPGPRTTLLEASGGINLSTIWAVAQTGVDIISVGALTHSAPSIDIGLDWS